MAQANYNIPVGTIVKFGPSSRLRSVDKKSNTFQQKEFLEGTLIGEGRTGKILGRVEEAHKIAYVVEIVETGHYGWTYNFEFSPV
jgi:hypothetical protein